ncbi:protein rep [uncultured Clostridium sp.]|uniref:protein rep n=1 Tax=uncultured Clostridium sp. TaxID=59620 RepID=UPI00260C0CA7|nr:protein rep [uncultured Clostridium sp.]
MEFTNEILKKINRKKEKYNGIYAYYYHEMSHEFSDEKKKYSYRSEQINDCLNLWLWDKYDKNKILDLQKVNRCNSNRFCPNCKLLDISKFIHEFKNRYKELAPKGYKAYMLTLTIPSVKGEELRGTLDKLNKTFAKLFKKFAYNSKTRKGYADRLITIDGGIKVLEITYNHMNGFHPHFHCVVLSKDNLNIDLLEKNIQGKFSNKRNEYNYKSKIDIQFGKLWSMLWYGDRLTKANIDSTVYDPKETYYAANKKCLEIDFRELDEKGIYEVFKYTVKDSDIDNYYVFKTLVQSLEGKRIRQGFGLLLKMQCENVELGELQELELEIEENPTSLLTRKISELVTTYEKFKKISRFQPNIDNAIK